MGTPGGMELILLLAVLFLLFGAKCIPDLAKSLGSGVREFREGTTSDERADEMEDGEVGAKALGEADNPGAAGQKP